jgi:hypothetical protein
VTELVPDVIRQDDREGTLYYLACYMRAYGVRIDGYGPFHDPENLLDVLRTVNDRHCRPCLPHKAVADIAYAVSGEPEEAGTEPYSYIDFDASTEHYLANPVPEVIEAPRVSQPSAFGMTAADFAACVPEEIDWLWGGYIAAGDFVELDGAPKRSGKSTLVWHLLKAREDGGEFLGQAVKTGKTVVLSEMSGFTLREQLRGAGLLGSTNVHIAEYPAHHDKSWPEACALALAKCQEVGADLLVIDTADKWAKMRGDQTWSRGEWLERIEHLQPVKDAGIATLLLHHTRKSGGEVGESGSGSNAFAGAMDTILQLRRSDQDERHRKLEAIGRYGDMTPESVTIALMPDGYKLLGEGPRAISDAIEARIMATMADGAEWTVGALVAAIEGAKRQQIDIGIASLWQNQRVVRTAEAGRDEHGLKTAARYQRASFHVYSES